MNNSETQSSSSDISENVLGVENPGAFSGKPSAVLPESAIYAENNGSSDFDYKTSFAEQTHTYIREYIQTADQKATFFFAFFAAIIAYSDSLGILRKWIINITTWHLAEAIAFLSSVLLVLAAFGCLWVVKPRLGGSKRGLIFFNAISEFESQKDYISEIAYISTTKIHEEKVKHIYEIAKVCSKKYKILGISLWLGGAGFALLVLLMLFK
jgi:hypothetical protein